MNIFAYHMASFALDLLLSTLRENEVLGSHPFCAKPENSSHGTGSIMFLVRSLRHTAQPVGKVNLDLLFDKSSRPAPLACTLS